MHLGFDSRPQLAPTIVARRPARSAASSWLHNAVFAATSDGQHGKSGSA
jgi:hypothetical protein